MAITRVSDLIETSFTGQMFSDMSPKFMPRYDEEMTHLNWDEYYTQTDGIRLIRHHFEWVRKGSAPILEHGDIVIQQHYPVKVYVHKKKVSDPRQVVTNNLMVLRPEEGVNAPYMALAVQHAINEFCKEHGMKRIALTQIRHLLIDYDPMIASKVQRRYNSHLNALIEAEGYMKAAMEMIEASNTGIEQEVKTRAPGRKPIKKSSIHLDCPHSFVRDRIEEIDGKQYVICKCVLCSHEKRLDL